MSLVICGDSPSFNEVLVDAHKANDVTAGHIINRLNVAAHHQHCPVWYVWRGNEVPEYCNTGSFPQNITIIKLCIVHLKKSNKYVLIYWLLPRTLFWALCDNIG